MIFEFYTEDGMEKLEYQDYLKRPEIMEKLHDKRRFFLNLGLRLFSFDRDWMDQHPKQKGFLQSLQSEWEDNPARYFLPHCANSPDFNTVSHKFINDADNIYTALIAGNRYGKSTGAYLKMLLTYGLIPTDKNWECFKDHGVKYKEFTGPKEVAVSSVNWGPIYETIWPQVVRFWTPNRELGEKVNWQPPRDRAFAVTLKCGSILHFKCARQPQSSYESQKLDGCFWDEQGTEANFDGMESRMKTAREYSKDDEGYEFLTSGFHVCGATPHKVEGRVDTGGGTWFEAMYNRTETKGLSSSFYEGDLENDVPDWIFPEREKEGIRDAMLEAEETGNKKQLRSLESRFYGRFETTGGMVYDEWDDQMHVITPFEIPSHWSAYRCMDHGRTNPTSCLWVAVSPTNDLFVYREMIRPDKTISENVKLIVQMSGNVLDFYGEQKTNAGMLNRYREKIGQDGEQYMFDVIDGRSFRSPDLNTRLNTGDLYRLGGLNQLRPAPIQAIETTLPIIKELLAIDPERYHYETKKRGAPRLYVFRSCPNLIKNIKAYRNKEDHSRSGVVSEKPHSKNDHDLDALRYGIMMAPRYIAAKPYKITTRETKNDGERKYWVEGWDEMDSGGQRRRTWDRFTGYR